MRRKLLGAGCGRRRMFGNMKLSNNVYGLLPRHKRNAVGRSTRESVAVVYPASGVSFIELVPTWNLRTGSHTF